MSATKLLVVLLIAALAVDLAVSKDPQAAPAAAGVVPVSLGRRLLRGVRAAAVATRNMLQVSRLTCKMHMLLLLCLWGACAGRACACGRIILGKRPTMHVEPSMQPAPAFMQQT